MKKILLIEDRFKRQQLFMSATKIDLNKYSEILDNFVEESYSEFELQLKNNNFNFDKYDYIISHESAFNKEYSELDKLEEYCKKYDKTLILFSGGISVNYYDNSEYELLKLNSKIFYSQNLVLFLEAAKKGNENILMLSYGEQWQYNSVFNVIEKVNLVLQRLDTQEILNSEFESFIEIQKLTDIAFNFYKTNIENSKVNILEIKKLKNSLYEFVQYMDSNEKSNQNALLIENDNADDELFASRIPFTSKTSDIDKYISKELISDLKNKEFNAVYIKDNLSSNYLELYGLRVAYHIRLSSDLEESKRYAPIFIISDFTSNILNKFEPMANILFTKNIFLIENSTQAIKKALHLDVKYLTLQEYKEGFLNKIEVEQPKDYLSHHSIANEWAIYRWAEFLKVEADAVKINRDKISSMLYFKYLIAKNKIEKDKTTLKLANKKEDGKILFIDDEWNKGWSDILHALFGNHLETFEYDYKDKSNDNLYNEIQKKVREYNPDVVILDLRLSQNDHDENMNIDDFSGIKILKMIHEINAGIQVIMLSATSKSTILEKLYDYKILGYIKKEHPDDITISTQKNINKLTTLVENGFENKYLKKIYDIKRYIADELDENPFTKYGIVFSREDEDEINYLALLQNNIEYIFNMLNTTMENRYNYAMVSIATSLETIVKIFLYEKIRGDHLYFWDNKPLSALTERSKLEDKILRIVKNRFGCTESISLGDLINYRNKYMHSNKQIKIITQDDILEWLNTYKTIITSISKPVKYKKYDDNQQRERRHHNFKKA